MASSQCFVGAAPVLARARPRHWGLSVLRPRRLAPSRTAFARPARPAWSAELRDASANESEALPDEANATSTPTAPGLGFALADARISTFASAGDFTHLASPGAYAVRDGTGVVVYVGYARDVGKRLASHLATVPGLCASFQTYLPDLSVEDVTPELLEGVLEYWIRETGGVPRGNGPDRALWEGTAADRKVVYGVILVLFLAASAMKQVMYYGSGF